MQNNMLTQPTYYYISYMSKAQKKSLEKLSAPAGTTLDRFISARQGQFSYASGELSQLLRDISLASKVINRDINRSGLSELTGGIGDTNIQGEAQQKLDVVADIRFRRALIRGGQTCGIVSEEADDLIDTDNHLAKYIVMIDPLDGSSNVDTNLPIGTIFSIYRRLTKIGTPPSFKDVLQKGDQQVAAGYILYSSSTMLVYTTGHGVNGFTLEPSLGEYFLSHPDIRINEEGKTFSVNDGAYHSFPSGVQKFIDYCREQAFSLRYVGALVADLHRILLEGGIYMYPSTQKYKDGKLRLLYECKPLAWLVEQAGGLATNGEKNINDILPKDKHQRTPLYIGSKKLVKKVTEL